MGELDVNTRKIFRSGMMFPTFELFVVGVELAVRLFPQRNQDGNITYLLGKGVGLELSIQGRIENRPRRASTMSYRTHSDLEIYAADTDGGYPYPAAFQDVFGGQEFFETIKSCGTLDPYISRDELRERAETVRFNGEHYLVPELELQFVDKFLKPGKHHRPEGQDAFVLAMCYRLNSHRVSRIFQSYEAVQSRHYKKLAELDKTQQVAIIEKRLQRIISQGKSVREAFSEIDDAIDKAMNGPIKPLTVVGITPRNWYAISINDVSVDGRLQSKAVAAIAETIDQTYLETIAEVRQQVQEGMATLHEANRAVTVSQSVVI